LPEEHYITARAYSIIGTFLNKFINVAKAYLVPNGDCIQQQRRMIKNGKLRRDFPAVAKVSR